MRNNLLLIIKKELNYLLQKYSFSDTLKISVRKLREMAGLSLFMIINNNLTGNTITATVNPLFLSLNIHKDMVYFELLK